MSKSTVDPRQLVLPFTNLPELVPAQVNEKKPRISFKAECIELKKVIQDKDKMHKREIDELKRQKEETEQKNLKLNQEVQELKQQLAEKNSDRLQAKQSHSEIHIHNNYYYNNINNVSQMNTGAENINNNHYSDR